MTTKTNDPYDRIDMKHVKDDGASAPSPKRGPVITLWDGEGISPMKAPTMPIQELRNKYKEKK